VFRERLNKREEAKQQMKQKLSILTIVGLAAGTLAAFAQTPTPTPDAPAPATNAPAVTEPATNAPVATQPVVAAEAASAATATTVAASAPAADAAPVAATASATSSAADPAPAATAAAATDPAKTNGVIRSIIMDELPLMDVIKNLALQANLNCIVDPSVSFGQPGPDGKSPQPIVSIRWENVTPEQALTALLNNYNLQLVEDPKSKIARITKKDPAAPDPLTTHIIQLKYASPNAILPAIQNVFADPRRSKVLPDVRTSQLVVSATEKEQAEVDKLIARLDTRTKQVMIEARLLETSVNPSTIKGIDWTGTLAAQHVTFGNNASGGILNAPPRLLMSPSAGSFFSPSMTFLNADGVAAVISFLNNYSETKVISSPRTVTLDNEPALIEVGTLYPIVNVTAGTANTTGGSQTTYSNLTVRLDVTPRISAENFVNLKVTPRVTRLGAPVVSTVAALANVVPSFETREIQTSVMIPSGNTLVMGGLMADNIQLNNTKVPVLGDIPVLGYLFRKDDKNRTKQNLIVFLTPTIIQDQDFQPTKADFLKNPVPVSDSLEGDWGAWDSGKPADFSKKDKGAQTQPVGSSAQPQATPAPADASAQPQATPATPAAAPAAGQPQASTADFSQVPGADSKAQAKAQAALDQAMNTPTGSAGSSDQPVAVAK
jgi:type II secretory pathway component GspD/PulD (secretin)